MANTDWPNKSLKIEREKEKTEAFQAGMQQAAMMIAGATGQGGSPGQSYQRPLQNPDPGEAVFGVEKDGQTFFEFLKAMGIFFPVRVPKNDPNKGKAPYDDKGNELSAPVPGRSDWAGTNKDMKIAGGPSFDIGPGHGAAKKKAKGFNKTRNNPNDKEVEMIKKWLGGPQLPDVSGSKIYKGIPNQFDKILDPSGTQKVRPTLDQLREGVRYKKGLA